MKRNLFFGSIALSLLVMLVFLGCQSSGYKVDTYTHASRGGALTQPGIENKVVLEGEELQGAFNFLVDSSHYWYTAKDLPGFSAVKYPETFDAKWKSPINGRVYRGPYYDPLTRSVCWLTVNPNGGVNVSLGSYWGVIPPNKDLPVEEAIGYEKSNEYQAFSIMGNGESTNNWLERERGTLAIDSSLSEFYGVKGGRHLFVEVKVDHALPYAVSPEEFYEGLVPTTLSWGVMGKWAAVDPSFLSYDDYWSLSDSERAEYVAKAKANTAVMEILSNVGTILWFDIMQIVSITDLIGFEYESSQGKVDGIDMDHDGYLDKYPEDHPKAGQLILSGGPLKAPEYALYLNYNDFWWYDYTSATIQPFYADGTIVPDSRTDEEKKLPIDVLGAKKAADAVSGASTSDSE